MAYTVTSYTLAETTEDAATYVMMVSLNNTSQFLCNLVVFNANLLATYQGASVGNVLPDTITLGERADAVFWDAIRASADRHRRAVLTVAPFCQPSLGASWGPQAAVPRRQGCAWCSAVPPPTQPLLKRTLAISSCSAPKR